LLAYLGGDADPEVPVPTDIAVLCETLVDDAADRGKRVRYEGPDHLELSVRPLSLKRAVSNLLENALHHGSHVSLRLAEEHCEVTICVEDDGPGLPDDQLDEVLKPFVRLDTSRPRDTVGFGLGLAIVARVVENDGGDRSSTKVKRASTNRNGSAAQQHFITIQPNSGKDERINAACSQQEAPTHERADRTRSRLSARRLPHSFGPL
jgi:K+-sensing histidine kinase KdpD